MIRNYTAHTVRVLSNANLKYNRRTGKWVTDNPVIIAEFHSEGVLSEERQRVEFDTIDNIKLYTNAFVHRDTIPGGTDYLIVSQRYREMAERQQDAACHKLLTVGEKVYDKKGNIIGCLGFDTIENLPKWPKEMGKR